ncbi:MAG: transposase [Bacteroidetes bacterium]|nr:transposase [Bacteroidota bacterium]
MIRGTRKQRKRLRLKEYDYSQPGAYFVTICTKDREERFGEIVDGEMRANNSAAVVWSCWNDLPNHYPNVELDAFVIMPNHVHGIIMVLDEQIVGATPASPLQRKRHRLGDIVGSFKSAVTKRANEIRGTAGSPLWQRGYYDHIIRDDRSLTRIREYIAHNPQRWASDKENSDSKGNDEFDRWMASASTRTSGERAR